MQMSLGNIRLVKDDGHLRQVIDAEGRRESVGIAENHAESALLLHYFHPQKVGKSFRIAHVDVKRTDVPDAESARPVTAVHVQQPDAEQLLFVQSRPVERQVTARHQMQVGRLRSRIGKRRRKIRLRYLHSIKPIIHYRIEQHSSSH